MTNEIDVKKETVFYVNRRAMWGVMTISLLLGLFVSQFVLQSKNYFESLPLYFLLVCLSVFIWAFYKGEINPVVLRVDKSGLYLPNSRFIPWNEIEMVYRSESKWWEFGGDFNAGPIYLGVSLANGTSVRINMSHFSKNRDELIKILQTYQGKI